MNHENIKDLILLYMLNELNEEEVNLVKNHLETCEECRNELKQLSFVHEAVLNSKPEEIDEYELQKARLNLLDALDDIEDKKSFIVLFRNFFRFISSKKLAPILGFAATLAFGIFIGYGSTSYFNNGATDQVNEIFNVSNKKDIPVIDNVTFLSSNPETGDVELGYTISKQIYYKGNFSDERTKRLIAMAVTNSNNSGLKITGINVINNQQDKEYIKDEKIKNALITAAKGDKNAGVRRQALITLSKFKPDDNIIEAYLFILTTDNNAAIRIEAINRLTEIKSEGYKIDEKTKSIISERAEKDDNKLVQIRAAKFINEEI
jgi:hypothetical protein